MPEDVPEITDPTESFLQQNLPFCPESLDVSNYKYVEPMTLQQASALCFNLASVNIGSDILKHKTVETPSEGSEGEEQTEEFSFTDVTYPDGEEGWGVDPFKISTNHTEQRAGPDGDPSPYLYYEEEEVEPRNRAACGAKGSSRALYSYKFVGSVFANVGFIEFVKMYDGDVDVESNHIGYGFPISSLQMHSGVAGLDANGVAYGNYAEDEDWEPDPDSGFFAYPNWWSEFGPYYGDWLISEARPDNVTNVNIDGFPFVAAYWTGRDAQFTGANLTATWTASGFPSSGAFNFYNYESSEP